MRKCLLVFGLLSTLFINAQTTNPVYKKEASNGTSYSVVYSYPQKNVIVASIGNDHDGYLSGLLEEVSRKNITPFIFDRIFAFYEGDFTPVQLNSKWGVINTMGQITVPCIYDDISSLTIDGAVHYIVKKGSRIGVINVRNESIVPFEYDYIRERKLSAIHLEVGKGGKMGLMNLATRKMVIPFIYDRMEILSASLVKVQKDNRYSIFNVNGEQVFSNWYTQLEINFQNEYMVAQLNGKKGVVSLSGKEIIPFEYEVLEDYLASEIYFICAKGGKYGLFGLDGKVVLPAQYDMVDGAGFDMVTVTNNNKKGMVTTQGSPVLPIEYDEVVNMESYFLLKKNNKYGFISHRGNVILPVEYDALARLSTAEYSRLSYLLATRNGKKAIVDVATGKPLFDFIYDDLIGARKYTDDPEVFGNAIIAIKNGKYGMIEMNGNTLVPFIYDDLQYLNSDLVIAGKGGKYGIVDVYNKNIVLPLEYQFVNNKDNTIIAYKNSYEKYQVSGGKITKVAN